MARAVEARILEAKARSAGRPGWCVVCNIEAEDWIEHVYSDRHRGAVNLVGYRPWEVDKDTDVYKERQ